MVRVRYAPSPTGYIHIGNLRTALYDELFARNQGGKLVLRIEDTDQTRSVEGAVDNIIRTLEWAGIKPDEGVMHGENGEVVEYGDRGPYIQSKRLDLYREHADKLIASGHAYRCFCSPETLEVMKKRQAAEGGKMMYDGRCRALSAEESSAKLAEGLPHVVRLAVPRTGETVFTDAVRGEVRFANNTIDDQVLMKSDGFPTYHLAVVVDDHLMDITHVFRGEEWLPSTPKHILLYKAFGWEPPVHAHLPLLLNPDKTKLSKRQGDVAAEDYRKKGYLPEALVNFIALLGWNPSGDREIYSKEELIAAFDLGKINKGGAVFNVEKLGWMNKEYMRALDVGEVTTRAVPFYVDAGILRREGESLVSAATGDIIDQDFLVRAVSLERERVTTLAELPEATAFFFTEGAEPVDADLHWKRSTPEEAKERLEGLAAHLTALDAAVFDDKDELERDVLSFITDKGWTNAETLWPMRVALTGRKASPSPFEVAWALGRDVTVSRIRDAIARLSS